LKKKLLLLLVVSCQANPQRLSRSDLKEINGGIGGLVGNLLVLDEDTENNLKLKTNQNYSVA
jgi:hypothetical protein